jgi:probable HAF family extracellular repeat protein
MNRSAVLLFTFAMAASPVQAQTYHLTDLGTLPGDALSSANAVNRPGEVAGSTEKHAFRRTQDGIEDLGALPGGKLSGATAINDKGAVVGASQFRNGGAIFHATLYRKRKNSDLGVLPDFGNYSAATGINKEGRVVGYTATSGQTTDTRAFIWDRADGMRDIGTLGGQYSRAQSINDIGMVTGSAQLGTGFGTFHAFVWDEAGGMRDLGTIGGDVSDGRAINEKGHVTGSSTVDDFNRRHAFLYRNGRMRDLGALGEPGTQSDFSYAYGVNDKDVVVGTTYTADGGAVHQVAFRWKDGTMSDLETQVDASGADYRLVIATGVNNAGQITVNAVKVSTGESRAVLLTPAE